MMIGSIPPSSAFLLASPPSTPSPCSWAPPTFTLCPIICTSLVSDDDPPRPHQRIRTNSPNFSSYVSRHSSWLEQELPRLLSMQKKPLSGIVLTRGSWTWDVEESSHYQLRGSMQFCNVTRKNEIFINEVDGRAVLLSEGFLNEVATSIQIHSRHPEGKPASRKDGYWPAYIIQAGASTHIEALRVEIKFISYGPSGHFDELQNVILPLQRAKTSFNTLWQRVLYGGAVRPVRTHLLCHMDDPLEILQHYVLPYVQVGDIIAIGETPLAIMQGRFRHPRGITPSVLAKLVCRCFHPTSSLATACGMQALIDVAGKFRVMVAVIGAVLARLLGVRGMFYQLAGEQARLLDDVSGTLPPYDQFITLGPVHAQAIADYLQKKTGYGVAIVDVNDLRRVHILAASDKVAHSHLTAALLTNPSGNADEQTPIVIVRPP